MKIRLTLLAMLFVIQYTVAQNFQTVEEVNTACATLGFAANEDAELTVDKIMEIIGLQKNFKLQECPNINNAIAKNIKNSSGRMIRYILYDNDFFKRIDLKAQNDWAAISILAHEIGHHLNGHALNNEGSNHEFELDADYFSGLILAKMGATLIEAQSAVQTLSYDKATTTHPAKIDRLSKIKRGWDKGIASSGKTDPLIEDLFRKATNGDVYAQVNLGYKYESGKGVKEDMSEAVYWYEKAAKSGYAKGQANLGYMLMNGLGTDKDYKKAIYWYKKAIKNDYVNAQTYLGYMYQKGYGVTQDYNEAEKWYRKAASQEEKYAQSNLGGMYYNGLGVEKNLNTSFNWYLKAANHNLALAQNQIAEMYYYGLGVEQDYKDAIDWYLKAAKQDYIDAQLELGRIYSSGEYVTEDYEKVFLLGQ